MFYIFLQFYLTSLRGKEYFARSRRRSEPGVFGPLEPEPEPLEKKYQEPEPLGKTIRSRSRLKKKSGGGAGAAKKFAGSPALRISIQCVLKYVLSRMSRSDLTTKFGRLLAVFRIRFILMRIRIFFCERYKTHNDVFFL